MALEDDKRTVEKLFARISAGDIDGALAFLSDDVVWRLAGKPELLPIAGTHDRKRLRKVLELMMSQLENGLDMRIVGMIGEGNRLAVEVESRGRLKNGRDYAQHYHFAFEMKDGKIASVREYLDTHHAFEVWFKR